MFAIAGTQKLLEGMDDVYSPVSRQFTKIQLGPFTLEKDTLDSIRKPLENLEARVAGQSGNGTDQGILAMTVSHLIHSLETSRMVARELRDKRTSTLDQVCSLSCVPCYRFQVSGGAEPQIQSVQ